MNTETTQAKKREPIAREGRRTAAPAVDVYENKEEVLLVADMPGVRPDDIVIRFERGELTLSGRRATGPEGAMLAAEYRFADFQRTFTVPQSIQADAIHAEVAHGVLKIHLPKVSAQKPRQIPVKAS
ncbi:MAG TPA: Hsp20/alpha crystallin family protein [Polyangium sp.]|jgi:HSP20 family molecular chaperone IbpA|nr:Hsp20/alpha crystallin family protein [Polyangium sp.]